ncbi:hypothetical protein LCGC14_0236010 [marine sediment metagenome]|uniref:Uncharacterized protein n=1 Tax=marine sediment metagenome TaxID=412755 RepID=A0A0F9U943_9ZZZZ
MGVSTHITLPAQVRVGDVAKVIGACVGLKKKWHDLGRGHKSVDVVGIKVLNTSVHSMVRIVWQNGKGNSHLKSGDLYYHFETGDERSGRLLSCSSWAPWIALGRRLVDFFGGSIDYNDCDSTDIDYQQRWKICLCLADDDEEWDDLQERIMKVKPITEAEILAADRDASYPLESR